MPIEYGPLHQPLATEAEKKPSETGPSPEEEWEPQIAEPVRTPMGSVYTDEQIEAIKLEAKRSAHLQDARAGCYACRDAVNYKPASQEPDHDRWVHVIATLPREWGCVTCERPEVWDALSLTGPPKP